MMWAILKLSAVFLLVLANAFFVAVEFALVSVKRVRIEALAATGDGGAKAALKALDHMDSMLSACQFGITLASLVLGAVGESTIAHLLEPFIYKIQIAFGGQFPIDPKLISHTIAITLALAIITYLHLVLGEYAPKAFAIEKAEAVSIATSKWLWWFYRTFKPFIQFINISGIKLLKMFGIDFRPGHHTVYNEDELRRLINISHQSGHIESDERELIHNVFEFTDLTVDEIMIPRTEVTAIDADADYDQVLRTFRESGYSRLPVFKDRKSVV